MVDSFAIPFLESIGELIDGKTMYLVHGSDEVNQAKRDLKKVEDFLMIADADRCDSRALTACIVQLRELAFDTEILLDTYRVEAESEKQRWRRSLKEKFHPRYNCNILGKHSDPGKEVRKHTRAIISCLADLAEILEWGLERHRSPPSSEQIPSSKKAYAHEFFKHVVGLEKHVELLISMVKDESRRSPRVINIYGMGGLGKTTLAQGVYYHEQVKSFARAWVCISQQFRPEATLGSILKQLDDKAQIDGMAVADLGHGIYWLLKHRRCLVVIDDIWENDHWEIIKRAFPMNCNVVLTTRNEGIANGECHPYKLNTLTEDQGWDLLRTIAFPQDVSPAASLEDIGRKIIAKCGGLPLAISFVGRILSKRGEHNLAEWKEVLVKIDLYISEGVKDYVLELSYNALPYYLKPCFLYLACFPEDENIETERLYLLWMAEGLLSHHHKGPNETLRDVAQWYVSELARRSMVQVQEGEAYSPQYSCRLHNLIHNLCTSKFGKELKRLDVSRYSNGIPSSTGRLAIPSSIGDPTMSRLAINNDGNTDALFIVGLEKIEGLRSFVLLGKGRYSVKRVCFDDSTMNLKRSPYLRILVLDNCDFAGGRLPRKVGELIHLRYLSLKFSNLRVLPEFVCSMLSLQTLDLRVLGFVRLPNLIWKMKRLRHLFLPCLIEVIGGEKLRLDGLVELETLENMESMTARAADIPKLTNLLTLSVGVNDMNSLEAIAHHMSRREIRLRETRLKIDACDLNNDVFKNLLMCPSLFTLRVLRCNISGGLPYYRQGMCENLVKLELFHCMIGGDVMEELGKYPKLRTLELEGGKIDKKAICRSNSFPQLKSLTLSQIPNLVKWEVEERALPRLTELSIGKCCNLEKVPDGLKFISTLRLLTISGMPTEFSDRVGVRGQDYGTVSHIPSINIIH